MATGEKKMSATDVAEARRLHAALRDFFIHQGGSGPDFRALRKVLALCEAASRAVADAYCREKLRVAAEYAAEMLSQRSHAKWGRDSASGAEFLRQQVLNALELYASRETKAPVRRARLESRRESRLKSGF
jgi:hypothetical protein